MGSADMGSKSPAGRLLVPLADFGERWNPNTLRSPGHDLCSPRFPGWSMIPFFSHSLGNFSVCRREQRLILRCALCLKAAGRSPPFNAARPQRGLALTFCSQLWFPCLEEKYQFCVGSADTVLAVAKQSHHSEGRDCRAYLPEKL